VSKGMRITSAAIRQVTKTHRKGVFAIRVRVAFQIAISVVFKFEDVQTWRD